MDEYDNIPDEFAGIDFSQIPELATPPLGPRARLALGHVEPDDALFDEVDDAWLLEVERIENAHARARGQPDEALQSQSVVDRSSPVPDKFDPLLLQLAAKLQEDFECPICYEILAHAHVGNPCGHSYCGACIATWLGPLRPAELKCPVCRTRLSWSNPTIPSLTTDHAISTLVEHLSKSAGHPEWNPSGGLYKHWSDRKTASRDRSET
ncbi:hypothetical protein OH77DRAFT_1432576 [Trametes cingulata]|nr:hypothetical protein OH77DRAFT_1432576 [Trametes cingulata]